MMIKFKTFTIIKMTDPYRNIFGDNLDQQTNMMIMIVITYDQCRKRSLPVKQCSLGWDSLTRTPDPTHRFIFITYWREENYERAKSVGAFGALGACLTSGFVPSSRVPQCLVSDDDKEEEEILGYEENL